MRKELKKLSGQRLRFRAQIERFGSKDGFNGSSETTILFKHIFRSESTEKVADHIWLTVGKTIEKLDLKIGDTVEFDARVSPYQKGYVNRRKYIDERTTDYKLAYPTNFIKI